MAGLGHRTVRAIHVVGPPASGKSELRRHLSEALGWPSSSIDEQRLRLLRPGRWWPDDDRIAWAQLRRFIEAGDCIIETAGTNRNLDRLLAGVKVLTIACYAPPSVRRRRLEARVRRGNRLARGRPDYVERLMAAATPTHPADLSWDGSRPASIKGLLQDVLEWVDVSTKA